MRWDIKVSVYFYFAAAFFAVCLMVAAVRLHLDGIFGSILLLASLSGCLVCTVAGVRAAIVGERSAPLKGHVKRMVGLYGMLICVVSFIGFAAVYFWPSEEQGGSSNSALPANSSRIVVSKFTIAPSDGETPPKGYLIDVWMINRGARPGNVPEMTYAFTISGRPLSDDEVDQEMQKSLSIATSKHLPPDKSSPQQLETGVENHITLARGILHENWNEVLTGKKLFYLFVVLVYKDTSLDKSQYIVSEFCGSRGQDPTFFVPCGVHNHAWVFTKK